MTIEQKVSREQMMLSALDLLTAAIQLLDRAGAPGHIATHLDLASHQLEDVLPKALVARLSRSDPWHEDGETVSTIPQPRPC